MAVKAAELTYMNIELPKMGEPALRDLLKRVVEEQEALPGNKHSEDASVLRAKLAMAQKDIQERLEIFKGREDPVMVENKTGAKGARGYLTKSMKRELLEIGPREFARRYGYSPLGVGSLTQAYNKAKAKMVGGSRLDIALTIGDKNWEITDFGGRLQISINKQVLAYFNKEYPEPFCASLRRMMEQVETELQAHGVPTESRSNRSEKDV